MKIKPSTVWFVITLLCFVAMLFAIACRVEFAMYIFLALEVVFGGCTIKSVNNEE